MKLHLLVVAACVLTLAACGNGAEPDENALSPWGVAGSASSARDTDEWFPKLSAAGVAGVRLFPEWRQLEPARGAPSWQAADAIVQSASRNRLRVNGILMGSPAWGGDKTHAFPMDALDDWSAYVSAAAGRYARDVRYWEVWNEGNGAFNDAHHTAVDYARLAAGAYAAAKKANPDARVGLSVASFDLAYLRTAIEAQARQGTPDAFDFVAVHPYEIAGLLADRDGEIPFLWMNDQFRQMLADVAPHRAGAELWITEVGQKIGDYAGRTTTEADAAKALVKIYTMAVAQGVARTEWFEGRDPQGEEPGFGLLDRQGRERPAYAAIRRMTTLLGSHPRYLGWVALGPDGRGYGFVFQGADSPVLVAWMPAGESVGDVTFEADVRTTDSVSGETAAVKASTPAKLGDVPVYVTPVPESLLRSAQEHARQPFPWGGNFRNTATVSADLGSGAGGHGIFQTRRDLTPVCTFPDGSTGIILRGDQSASFFVHPSFANFRTREYYVRISVRRLAPGNLGMNVFYESAEGLGRAPYKNKGEWYSVPADDGWHTHVWHLTDACFTKMWGYDFSISPEQSVPFVLGKVEVSTSPLK